MHSEAGGRHLKICPFAPHHQFRADLVYAFGDGVNDR